MLKIKNFINKLSKFQKAVCLILILFFVILLVLSITIPLIAKYKNESTIITTSIWHGNLVGNEEVNLYADIHVGAYTWNNLKSELSTVNFNSSITFSIEPTDFLNPPKEIYYYVSDSTTVLTEPEVLQISTWNSYNNSIEITEEGFYTFYVKIVDINDDVTYMNTDLLVIDLSNPTVNVSLDDNTWSNLRGSLENAYIDRQKSVTVEANDSLSGILSIKCYITDQILTTNDLNALNVNDWTSYSNEILIDEVGTYIVYAQVIDNSNHTTYVNTDYIVLNGYTTNSLIIGRNVSSYVDPSNYITNKSTITLNVSYSNTSSDLNGYTHNLISNILLPMGTKITLIDNITDKVYEYQITTDTDIYNYEDSCDIEDLDCINVATYPFTLFKEVGTGVADKLYLESSYYNNGVVSEDFAIVLDLSGTNISINYDNVALYMELHDTDGVNVRPTLFSTIKGFNIYSNVNSEDTSASLNLTTDYSGNEIIFNSDSSTNINITSAINYKSIDSFKIIDTAYEDKEIGISVKLVDSEGNVVDKEYLKSVIFKIGESVYYPGKDNIVRISLNSGITDVTQTLTIVTRENNSNLKDGTYYFKISNYTSDDGYHYAELNNTELSVPVNILSSSSSIQYSFDVMMDDASRIINKTSNETKILFNILQNGSLENPNIRISLYKKDKLTAFDQNYVIVNLADYVSDTLNPSDSNVYYVTTAPIQYSEPEKLYNNFELNLITASFENIGYKFVFDLYDGTKKIGTIEKHFIVR